MSIVTLAAGTNIQTAINANPSGTIFQLSTGTYRGQQIQAKSNDQFIGAAGGGTVINGAMVLNQWAVSGAYWRQSGLPSPRIGNGVVSNPLANNLNDLFIDNTLYQRVSSLAQVTAGKWYFDTATSSAYIADNPIGRTVEYSVTPNLTSDNGATGVVVQNLTIEKYATNAQIGALHGVRNWQLIDVTARWNHGAGVTLGAGTVIQGGHYVDNGQTGIEGNTSNGAQILNAEIARNNYAGFATDWDAGGLKVTYTSDLVISGCYVHDNFGQGLWADLDCNTWTISNNTVIDNDGNGIMYEISDSPARISNNAITNNGGAGIYISNSDGVEAFGNTITVRPTNVSGSGGSAGSGGIDIINASRGSGANGVYEAKNNNVHDNVIIHPGDNSRDGIYVFQAIANLNTIWNNNTYYVPNTTGAFWHFGSTDYTWSSLQQNTFYESSGIEYIGPPPSSLPPISLPPTSVTTGSGPDSLILKVSENAYANLDGTSDANGDATFTVSIDGNQQGGTLTALASDAAGAIQLFTFNGSFGTGSHSVVVTFLNDAYNSAAPDATGSIDRNLYINDISYLNKDTGLSAWMYNNGPQTFTVTGGTAAASAPAPVTTGSGSDTLVLSMSEDAYNGDAQFTVSVDGKQLAGIFTTTALHTAGASQSFTFKGDWAPGAHTVAVNFLNDAYGGTAATDRNLYVDSISYNGTAIGQNVALKVAGPRSFSATDATAIPSPVTGSGSDTLVLSVSEDAYLGNAQFTVAVDGKQLGGTFTATALHATGASQGFTFKGDFGAGQHAVAVKFLNDAYGGTAATDRNLYVNGITYNGTNTVQSAALWSAGVKSFAVSGGTTPSVTETGDHGSLAKNLAQTGTYTVGGDTFVLSSGNAATVTLSTGVSQITFIGASSVSLTGGSGKAVVTADAGGNRFVAGTGSLDVTGGGGKDGYVFHANSGLLTVADFSPAQGDTLTVDKALQGSLKQASDGQGGTMLTFGAGHAVDIHGIATLPASSILWA